MAPHNHRIHQRRKGKSMGQGSYYRFLRSIRLAFSAPVWLRSVQVAAVVGIALNLINQGDAILHGFRGLDLPRFFLNFFVPYLVATYSAVQATLGLECKKPGSDHKVSQDPGQDGA